MSGDNITFDLAGLEPDQVAELLVFVSQLRAKAEPAGDEESWRSAPSTGWERRHLDLLREHLSSRGASVQLAVLDRELVVRREIPLVGLPNRARVSASGRMLVCSSVLSVRNAVPRGLRSHL